MNTEAKIFLTDYASYNEGTQFQFGHWVDLGDYSDADELNEYISEHFKQADKESPLECGSKREEIMITDYEGFPSSFYSESMGFDDLYEWLDLDEGDRRKVSFILEQNGGDFKEALEMYENVNMYEYDNPSRDMMDIFEMYFSDAYDNEKNNPYITYDEEQFIRDEFTEFTDEDGNNWVVADSWNH